MTPDAVERLAKRLSLSDADTAGSSPKLARRAVRTDSDRRRAARSRR